jgi:hypothetical protein
MREYLTNHPPAARFSFPQPSAARAGQARCGASLLRGLQQHLLANNADRRYRWDEYDALFLTTEI